jgi:hypothetical protein
MGKGSHLCSSLSQSERIIKYHAITERDASSGEKAESSSFGSICYKDGNGYLFGLLALLFFAQYGILCNIILLAMNLSGNGSVLVCARRLLCHDPVLSAISLPTRADTWTPVSGNMQNQCFS